MTNFAVRNVKIVIEANFLLPFDIKDEDVTAIEFDVSGPFSGSPELVAVCPLFRPGSEPDKKVPTPGLANVSAVTVIKG